MGQKQNGNAFLIPPSCVTTCSVFGLEVFDAEAMHFFVCMLNAYSGMIGFKYLDFFLHGVHASSTIVCIHLTAIQSIFFLKVSSLSFPVKLIYIL